MYDYADENSERDSKDLAAQNYHYAYPHGLDLKPKSDFHEKLKRKILSRAQASHDAISVRHDAWRQTKNLLTAFIPPDEEIKKIRKDDPKAPLPVVVPLAFAVHDVMKSHIVGQFLKKPYFRYAPTGGEDLIGVAKLEKIIDHNCNHFRVGKQIETMIDHALWCGMGLVSPTWKQEFKRKAEILNIPVPGGVYRVRKQSEVKMVYEGNRLLTINPFLFLPDPNMPIDRIQDSEFVGWIEQTNFVSLLSDEYDTPHQRFNAKYLKHCQSGRTTVLKGGAHNGGDPLVTYSDRADVDESLRPVDVIWKYINLVPNDWNLGPSKRPEKWVFGLAGDEVIIMAQPVGLNHCDFPVAACAPYADGISVAPQSSLEVTFGLQELANFLMNSHIENVRSCVNNKILFHPGIVSPAKWKKSRGGDAMAIEEEYWDDEKAMDKAYRQILINDFTKQNIGDMGTVMEIVFRATGATEVMQGVAFQKSERISAREADATQQGAVSRVGRIIQVISLQAACEIAHQFASNTQQLMTQDMSVQIAGRFESVLRSTYGVDAQYVDVTPFDLIDVEYDVTEGDAATMKPENSQALVQLAQLVAGNPLLAAEWDAGRIIERVAEMEGVRNVEDFRRKAGGIPSLNPQIMGNAQVMQEVQAGNLVPARAAA